MAEANGEQDEPISGELVSRDSPLMTFRSLPAIETREVQRPSNAFLAAFATVVSATPELERALKSAAGSGDGFRVAFSPTVTRGLRDGSLRLMQSNTGNLAVAVETVGGTIVEQGRVVAAAGAGAGAGLIAGGGIGAAAVVALPVVIAGAAAYAQQRQLEKSLASIKAVVERIEQRLEDADTGVCDAADEFLLLVEEAWADGGLSDYVRTELAAQRTATEALYGARRRWVERFKQTLEREQTQFEKTKGRVQPWVDSVAELAKDGKLEQELILFVRALLSRTKLGVVAASALAEDGRGATALKLIDRLEKELRGEFFDLQRRLVPLARYAPEGSILHKLPGLGNSLERAHHTVKTLVEHLNEHVLPLIPNPYEDRDVVADLDAATVNSLVARLV